MASLTGIDGAGQFETYGWKLEARLVRPQLLNQAVSEKVWSLCCPETKRHPSSIGLAVQYTVSS